MKPVTAPINPNSRGAVVEDLQDALLFLIVKGLIGQTGIAAGQAFIAPLCQEITS